jgi:hypothetical protein
VLIKDSVHRAQRAARTWLWHVSTRRGGLAERFYSRVVVSDLPFDRVLDAGLPYVAGTEATFGAADALIVPFRYRRTGIYLHELGNSAYALQVQ